MTATPSWTTSHRIDHHKVPSQVSNILEMNGRGGGGGGVEIESEQGGQSKDLIGRVSLRKSRMINKREPEEENGGRDEGSKLI